MIINIEITRGGCYNAIGRCLNDRGYPRTNGTKLVRFLWEKKNGKISKDRVIRHKCDNRLCVNLLHVELGTCADNTSDMFLRGRAAIGELCGSSKLKEHEVIFILNAKGKIGAEILANKFGVRWRAIYDIWNGSTWNHISGIPHKRKRLTKYLRVI